MFLTIHKSKEANEKHYRKYPVRVFNPKEFITKSQQEPEQIAVNICIHKFNRTSLMLHLGLKIVPKHNLIAIEFVQWQEK